MRFSEAYPGIPNGRDACGIIAIAEKSARPSHANVQRTIESLYKMAHRAGLIRGEGDGTGIQTDLPRELWAGYLYEAGLDSNLAQNPRFFVGHLFIPKSAGARIQELFDLFRVEGSRRGIKLLLERKGETNSRVLGPVGKRRAAVLPGGRSIHRWRWAPVGAGLATRATLPGTRGFAFNRHCGL